MKSSSNPKMYNPKFISSLAELKTSRKDTSHVVQWLRFCSSVIWGVGLIPGWEIKILYAAQCG